MNRGMNNVSLSFALAENQNFMRKIKTFCFSLLLVSVIWLTANSAAFAQAGLSNLHPNLARGSGNDKTLEKYEWDNINLFNGNLNVSIPLNIKYPLAGEFGYQFNLTYNSNLWDFEQPSSLATATPIKNSNAGFGWDLSFGRLIAPVSNGAQIGRWVYISPDGALHAFYSTLHHDLSESDPGELTSYTRDGTYYRMKLVGADQAIVEAPDGTQTLFRLVSGEWRLSQINDRFNNRLTSVIQSSPSLWTLSDNHGRTHRVYFKADPTGYYSRLIEKIELAAFNSTIATYTFTYTTVNVPRPGVDNDPATSASINLPLLTSVTYPDGSKNNFTYHGASDAAGRLASMQLPTMGKIEWDYQTYRYTTGANPTPLSPIFRQNTGVATRRLINMGGGVEGTWTYTPSLQPSGSEEREMTTKVKTPLGDKTVYYFSVNTLANGSEWNKADYGLPFTKNAFDRPRSQVTNVALAANGATANASNTANGSYPASATINSDRRGLNWSSGGIWIDGSPNFFPDCLEVSFSGSKTIDRINIFTAQDNASNAVEPTSDMIFTQHGIKDFELQYWNGSGWAAIPGGSVIGNDKVWRQFFFSPISTSKIRVVVTRASTSSRIVEIEAFESVLEAGTRFLSKQVFDCDGAGNNCQVLRSTYVRYEQDSATDPTSPEVASTNRREASTRIVYNDDFENGVARFADTNLSNFDGLGHYRQVTTSGNFGSGDVKTIFINYDAATGSYPSASYAMPSPANAWLLNTVNLQRITEGLSSQVIEFCYDRNNGFLKRVRRWSTTNPTGVASSNDVITIYSPHSSGQVAKEQYYGGDAQPVGTTQLCNLALPATDQYLIQHSYEFGIRKSSQFYAVSGTPVGPKLLDQTIDFNTGLASISRDVSGLATSYEYDAMGRQIWVKPEAGHGAWTQIIYTPASATDYAKKFTQDKSEGGASMLTYNAEVYDSFGRVWWEQTLISGSYPNRYKNYNAMGWIVSKSEFSNNEPKYTEFLNYDPFGRPQTVRPPDGAQHDVTYQYVGERSVTKTAVTGLMYNASSGQIIEGPRSKIEFFDRQGRLWKQLNESSSGYQSLERIYSYDAVGRLTQTTDGNGVLLGAVMAYDGRGFLFYVRHNFAAPVSYKNFDARGNSQKRKFALIDLNYAFDRAGRLTKVSETDNPQKVWKEFTYADINTANNWQAGRLATAKRYNYMSNWGGPVGGVAVVTEKFTYGGKGGRVSSYEVSLSDGAGVKEQFSQSTTYTDLGDIEQTTYPNSTLTGSGSTGRTRTVTNSYTAGRLSAITGTLNSQSDPWVASISYHPNGLISQLAHSNGVTDNFTSDPNGLVRLAGAFTTGVKKQPRQPDQNLYSGDFQYDGFQNLIRVGTEFFLAQEGQSAPNPADQSFYKPPCQGGLTDPFGISVGMSPDGDCFPTTLFYYTASDALFKTEERNTNTKTWYFYDCEGKKLTEYNVKLNGGTWLSTRDYVYRGSSLLGVVDILKDVVIPKVYHFHVGFGIPGIQTDANGFKTSLDE